MVYSQTPERRLFSRESLVLEMSLNDGHLRRFAWVFDGGVPVLWTSPSLSDAIGGDGVHSDVREWILAGGVSGCQF